MPRVSKSAQSKKVVQSDSSSEEIVSVKPSKTSSRASSRSPKDKSQKKPVSKDSSSSESGESLAPAPVVTKKSTKKSARKQESSESDSETPLPPKKPSKAPKKGKATSELSDDSSLDDVSPARASKSKVLAKKDQGSKQSVPRSKPVNPAILPDRLTLETISRIVPVKKSEGTYYLNIGQREMLPGFRTRDLCYSAAGFTVPQQGSKYYPREADVTFMRVPMDFKSKGGEALASMFHNLFEHLGSRSFKKQMFGDRYKNFSLAKSSSISLTPDEWHLKNAPPDRDYVPNLSMAFRARRYKETEWSKGKPAKIRAGTEGMGDDNDPFIEVDLIEERDPEDKSTRKEIIPSSMAVIREHVPFGSTFRIGFRISHIWVVKQEYGVRIYIEKLVVIPRETSAPVTYVSDDDSFEEDITLPQADQSRFGASKDEDSESESSEPPKKAPSKKTASKKSAKKEASATESSEDLDRSPKKGAQKEASVSESSEEPSSKKAAPKKTASKKSAKKEASVSESSEERTLPPKKNTKGSKKSVPEPSEEESSSDLAVPVQSESDSDSEPAPAKRSAKRK